MTLAHTVAQIAQVAEAITLTGGYATSPGTQTLFLPATVLQERRNHEGRVTFGHYLFPDDSTLTFRYSPALGARFTPCDATRS
ncbi:hypothetical protein [Telmatospirillum sp.]|uniref:hypothetical protein n=1 Tax=Telmatospirillum sp. TaxID=2079197 RepID=UPI00283C4D3C|nr:hypothetical protein [Telmatospirillum sp.]MDR3436409.1 hypothetical protein [Telmatospirillum sp.]